MPLQRGISETYYVKTGTLPLPSAAELTALYDEFYAGETFVEVASAPPALKDVAGTNYCRIFPYVDTRAGRIVVISVIDNLMKGASGQAVQNMNVMLACPSMKGWSDMLPTSRFAPLPEHVKSVGGGLTAPHGFPAAGVASGVKKRGKLDLGLVLSEQPAVSAATFTSNAAAAAPVRLTRETSDCTRLRAVVVNAGNANACTGKQGLADAARMRLLTANHLRLPVEQVAVCSTGLIGVDLPMDKIEPGIAAAAAALPGGGDDDGVEHFSAAIRTTDKDAKKGVLEVVTPEGKVKLGFAAKGCGMISPNMATMLCFVTCDAEVDGAVWTDLLQGAVQKSFNLITVDGRSPPTTPCWACATAPRA